MISDRYGTELSSSGELKRFGKYQLLGPHDGYGSTDNVRKLVLDTCVAIDLQHFYFGTASVDTVALQTMLLNFPNRNRASETVDINYGWACSESAWSRTSKFSPVAARQIDHAVGEILTWTSDRIAYEFEHRRPPVSRDKRWPKKVHLPNPDEIPNVYPILFSTYGAMLKVLELESTRQKWKSCGAEWAARHYHDWMRDDLGIMMSYELAVGIDMFLARGERRRSARKLFKYGGSETVDELADRAWNAAWDCFFTRLPEGLTYGLLSGSDGPVSSMLVTANKDPRYLRMVSEVSGVVTSGDMAIPLNMNTIDDTVEYSEAMRVLLNPSAQTTIARFKRDPDSMRTQAMAAVDELEKSMGITKRTLGSYLSENSLC